MAWKEQQELLEKWAKGPAGPWGETHGALRAALERLGLAEKIAEETRVLASMNKVGIGLTTLLNEWDDLVVRQEK
jgi:hypothetical protein